MASKRWIKLWRKAIDDPIFYGNATKFGFWCWMCSKAMTEDGYYPLGHESVYLKRGQFIYGRNKASAATGIPASTLSLWIKQFTKMGMIQTHVVAHRYTIIEVSKYKAYQDDFTKDNIQHDMHTSVHTSDTVVEDKRVEIPPSQRSAEEFEPSPFGEDPLVLLERWKKGNGI